MRLLIFTISFCIGLIGGNMKNGRKTQPLPDISIDYGVKQYVNLQKELARERSILRTCPIGKEKKHILVRQMKRVL